MKYFLIAGERSGDLHGANLIEALKASDETAEFVGIGGAQMEAAGMKVHIDYADMAFMGLVEVLQNLRAIRRNLKKAAQLIQQEVPDALILIDYGGFNMKLASRLRKAGYSASIFYYISPKVWAWNQKRAVILKRLVDRMFVILPFEKDFYKGYDWDVDYVGNPVMDAVNKYRSNLGANLRKEQVVALLPGSRKQELKYLLPDMKKLAENHPEIDFYVAKVDNLDPKLYHEIEKLPNVRPYSGNTYDLLSSARAAIVTSGTATLETALFNVPQVVIYRASPITYAIGIRFVKVSYISLVNLIAGAPVVDELLQGQLNESNLERSFTKIWKDGDGRKKMLEEYEAIYSTLSVGKASENTAELMVAHLRGATNRFTD